jgi:hypothetical protein
MLLAMLVAGCRVSFDVTPRSAAQMDQGTMTTTEGEVVETPEEIDAVVFPPGDDLELGTLRWPAAPCRVAGLYPEEAKSDAERHGVSFEDVTFEEPGAVARLGDALLVREPDGCAYVPLGVVGRVEVTDRAMRRGRIAAIVVPSVLAGAAIIALFAYGISQLDPY